MKKKPSSDLKALIQKMESGHRLSLARLMTIIENRDAEVSDLMKDIYPKTGKAQIWGITGPPGAGKSTLSDQVASVLRAQGKRVGIIAVDPSSPFSGGALLGDRIRMQRHAHDDGVFVRSLGTRGSRGGLSQSAKEIVLLLDAAGFDVILVETAGVGQTELDILKLAHSVVVVLVPESGDSIQVMKAGIMEIADLFVVNKYDRPAGDQLVKELSTLVAMSEKEKDGWTVPVQTTIAPKGEGVSELVEKVQEHAQYLQQSGKIRWKNDLFVRQEIVDILTEKQNQQIQSFLESSSGKQLIESLRARKRDPYTVAREILQEITNT